MQTIQFYTNMKYKLISALIILASAVLSSSCKKDSQLYLISVEVSSHTDLFQDSDINTAFTDFKIECQQAVDKMTKEWINNCISDAVATTQFELVLANRIAPVFSKYQLIFDECKDPGSIDYALLFELLNHDTDSKVAEKRFAVTYSKPLS